ncbi:TIGR02452 family protein [Lacticaseibacillus porcinae]|uniref:TIGR02452 family protein n=1 Tax=Lacticaseibacillus porcinae TaxID=1123687 RepID=UPI000F7842F1
MNQIQMFRQTMAAFKADPEWPTSHLITEPIPETPALGRKRASWRAINADVFAVMSEPREHVGVMNFASPTNPGGGVEFGAKAQEESIAKGTYLVPALRQFESSYYAPNRAEPNGGLNTPNLIYSQHVRQVFDHEGQMLVGRYVDIVTVAAPNLRRYPDLDETKALVDIEQKIMQTLRAFKANSVRVPILGAFGCGVFGNSAYAVGKLFGQSLRRREFNGAWDEVVFALYDPHGEIYGQFVKGLRNQEQ